MKAKELMIGDWVKICNGKGEYIDDTQVSITILDLLCQDTKIMKLEPIPLTDAFLKANGFKREGGASYWHKGDYNAAILHWNEDKVELIIGSKQTDGMFRGYVHYVHDVQHAFAFCGIDKDFIIKKK